jgi:hypothetical protein
MEYKPIAERNAGVDAEHAVLSGQLAGKEIRIAQHHLIALLFVAGDYSMNMKAIRGSR